MPDPDDPTSVREQDAPMRWADMDLLGHVNNVRFLDYLAEGRAALLLEHGIDPTTARLTGHRLGFEAPMAFGRRPARVRTWLVDAGAEGVRLAQEVSSREGEDVARVHLRTETTLGLGEGAVELFAGAARGEGHTWRDPHVVASATHQPTRHRYAVSLRERDLGRGGTVRDDALLEVFQESRIRYFMDMHTRGEQWTRQVVARTDLDLLDEVRPGPTREVRSWVAHVGGSSFTLRADLCTRASGAVLARATVVMVCFDPETQRPTPMTDDQRARLGRELG